MQEVIYTNEKGNSVKLAGKPFFLESIEGTGAMGVEIYSQKSPSQDGMTHTGGTLEARPLTINVVILTKTQSELYRLRERLSKVFNPKLKGTLRYKNNHLEKEISVIVDSPPVFATGRGLTQNMQRCLISLIAPNPFWQDLMKMRTDVASWISSLEFPLEITSEGIEMGYREPSLIANIHNQGDVECGLKIEFRALATVVNPSLLNVDTGEFIKINKTMEQDELITITTHFMNKKVTLNQNGVESNIFNLIDSDSTFLQLDVGDNLFRYDAEEGLDNLQIQIFHSPQYVGV